MKLLANVLYIGLINPQWLDILRPKEWCPFGDVLGRHRSDMPNRKLTGNILEKDLSPSVTRHTQAP